MTPTAPPPDGLRGFSLLEVSIALAVFSAATVLGVMTFVEGSSVASLLTADTELRQRANSVLEAMAADLRSTRTGAGAVQVVATSSSMSISFFKIASATHDGAVFATQRTSYSWNPQDASKPNLRDSRIAYAAQTGKTAFLCGEVESLAISPVAANFAASAPQTLDVTLVLRRDRVVKPDGTSNPKGSIWVRTTARITIPKGRRRRRVGADRQARRVP